MCGGWQVEGGAVPCMLIYCARSEKVEKQLKDVSAQSEEKRAEVSSSE